MKVPLLLIVVAGVSASVVAYGTYPIWMRYPHGLDAILWSRRLQWPLVAVSLIACVLLISLAISGRRRAWWLVGLAPVLALFAHRFATGPAAARMTVLEHPQFVGADNAAIDDDAWVVGVKFGDGYFAYPYARLFSAPLVIQEDHEKRMILMWSAFANRAVAMPIGQELRARDLEVVSTPANALLLYNSRRGQFINAVTGQTTSHEKPAGFANGPPLVPEKMSWRAWKALHPQTQVLAGPPGAGPTQPIQPIWPMPLLKLDHPADTRVALVGSSHPIMVEPDPLAEGVENSTVEDLPIVIFRELDQPIRVFSRRVLDDQNEFVTVQLAINDDLLPASNVADPHPHATSAHRPRGAAAHHPRGTSRPRPKGAYIDINSNTGWNAEGVCVDPQSVTYLKGKKLASIPVDAGLPLGVMKFWYPDLAPPVVIETKVDVQDAGEQTPIRRRH